MTFTQQGYWVVNSMHPDSIVAAKARAIADGFDLGPPWLPSDEGVLYGTRKVDRPLPPHRVGFPAHNLTPAPLRLWPLPVVLGLAALAGALGGWLA